LFRNGEQRAARGTAFREGVDVAVLVGRRNHPDITQAGAFVNVRPGQFPIVAKRLPDRVRGTARPRKSAKNRRFDPAQTMPLPRRREQSRAHGVMNPMPYLSRQTTFARPGTRGSIARFLAIAVVLAGAMSAHCAAQSAPVPRPAACPPGISKDAPVIGRDDPNQTLSEELAESKGIICPPAGVDSEMRLKPPQGGAIKIIRPPGTPGGDPTVQPK
jgi:hypothetical protein